MPNQRDPSKVLLQVWVDRDELKSARERAGNSWPDVVRGWLHHYAQGEGTDR